MKKFLKIWIIIMVITLIMPLMLGWIAPQVKGEYVRLDSVQHYSDLFYECDESEIPLYDLQLEEDNEKLTKEFAQKFTTLEFKSVSPFMSAVVRSLSFRSKNRYAHYRFNRDLISKNTYYGDENIYDWRVQRVVEKSEKMYEISIYKIFGKAYAIADYMPGFMRFEGSGDFDDRYTVLEITDCDDLQALISTKKYNEMPILKTLSNPYVHSPFGQIFGFEVVVAIVDIALIIRDKRREKLGLKEG